jgi:hypothetical protein
VLGAETRHRLDVELEAVPRSEERPRRAVRDPLARQARARRGAARRRARAAIAHAGSFATWHSLTRQGGLEDDEAVALLAAMVAAAADGP